MDVAVRERASESDVVVMAAAVADYMPAEPSDQKMSKTDGPLTLVLTRTPDILERLGRDRRTRGDGPVLVGFAAETEEVIERAKDKLRRKHVDLIVANDVSRHDAGFDVETNVASLVTAVGVETLPLQSKASLAHQILDRVERLLEKRPARAGHS
jgi:phosphopantothenoylcysteine decarboxylase/phosphopantothenate--cysteine ligase